MEDRELQVKTVQALTKLARELATNGSCGSSFSGAEALAILHDADALLAQLQKEARPVRMLTREELHELAETVGLGSVTVQRKFCEVNNLTVVRAAAALAPVQTPQEK
jgi:hypothetical protein